MEIEAELYRDLRHLASPKHERCQASNTNLEGGKHRHNFGENPTGSSVGHSRGQKKI